LENRVPVACRRVPAGAEGVDAWVRRDDARHFHGFRKVPRHIPRLGLARLGVDVVGRVPAGTTPDTNLRPMSTPLGEKTFATRQPVPLDHR
jgi:hypothetical protein